MVLWIAILCWGVIGNRYLHLYLWIQQSICFLVYHLADAVDLESLDLQPGLTYEERPIAILDHDERKVKRNMVKFIKIQWSNHSEDEATWEREDRLRQEYPEFFSDE